MDKSLKELVLENEWLYRGTSATKFNYCKQNFPSYSSRYKRNGIIITSTSMGISDAMIAGKNRWGKNGSDNGYFFGENLIAGNDCILLAINPKNYVDSMEKGIESYFGSSEIEIIGGIDYKDIIIINSMKTFLQICKKQIQYLKILEDNPIFSKEIVRTIKDQFKKNYLRM